MDHHADALHAAIDEVLAGHRDAFRHIVRAHGLAVRGFIGSQLYHLDDVDDLAQDVFLAAALDQHEPMTVFLVNGVMLQGFVTGFDQFAVVLERAPHQQLVYKHAISTVVPSRAVNFSMESSGEN